MAIELLDNNLINKIAAGEVVERPASVVKELVENAIDAGSTEITIEIENGGKTLIKISDNGCGINHDEILLAFSRHATSKIKNLEDLENIESLGFRGEALSSISSISNVELTTRTANDELAKYIELSNGEILSEKFVNRSFGTTFVIRDLFYNVPVRLKFLKKNNIESSLITDIVTNLILSNSNIAFKFINNGQTLLRSEGDFNLKKIVQQIAGSDLRDNLINLDYKKDEIEIKGVISNLNVSRSTRKNEYLFINSRAIKNKMIESAIEGVYNHFLENKYPVFVLNIEISPQNVDVNVHPTKLEVRFEDETLIYETVVSAIEETLKTVIDNSVENKIPSIDFKIDKNNQHRLVEQKKENNKTKVKNKVIEIEQFDISKYNVNEILNNTNFNDNLKESVLGETYLNENSNNIDYNNNTSSLVYTNKSSKNSLVLNDSVLDDVEFKEEKTLGNIIASGLYEEKNNGGKNKDNKISNNKNSSPTISFNNKNEIIFNKENKKNKENKENKADSQIQHGYKIIGQIFGTYWLLEKEENLYFFDQHAGHEIYLYYKFLDEFKNSKLHSQILLEPKIITLEFKQSEYLMNNLELFKDFGYDIEVFDDNIYTLKSVPIIFDEPSSVQFFIEMIDDLSNLDLSIDNIYELKIEKIMMMSCRSAIKANDKITEREAVEVINNVLGDESLLKCPHGRPTLIKISKKDIEKMFKRI